jgi:hypothetical protein
MNQRLSGGFPFSILAPGLLFLAAATVAAVTVFAASVEVMPSIQVAVEAASLQKNVHGGVARLHVQIDTDTRVSETVVTLRTPNGVVFADGSTLKTWSFEAGSHGRQTIPVEVIAAADGAYLLSAELTGMLGEQPVHRGASYRLAIGVTDAKPPVRNGAIEFAAVPGDGGAR